MKNEYMFVPVVFPAELSASEKLDIILKTFKASSDAEAFEKLKISAGYIFKKVYFEMPKENGLNTK